MQVEYVTYDQDLNVVVQGYSSIPAYFTKIKSLWDELDVLKTLFLLVVVSVCGVKQSIKVHHDETLL